MSGNHLGAHSDQRWPLEPLLTYTGQTPSGFARTHGIRPGSVCAAVRIGCNDRQADHWALAAGTHPTVVWGPEWDTAGLDPAEGSEDMELWP